MQDAGPQGPTLDPSALDVEKCFLATAVFKGWKWPVSIVADIPPRLGHETDWSAMRGVGSTELPLVLMSLGWFWT